MTCTTFTPVVWDLVRMLAELSVLNFMALPLLFQSKADTVRIFQPGGLRHREVDQASKPQSYSVRGHSPSQSRRLQPNVWRANPKSRWAKSEPLLWKQALALKAVVRVYLTEVCIIARADSLQQ